MSIVWHPEYYAIWEGIIRENNIRSSQRLTNADGSLMTGCKFGDGFDENGNSLITGTKGYNGGRIAWKSSSEIGSAPDDLGEGGSGVGGSSSMLATGNCSQFAMFYSLLAQHLDVGLTDGLSTSGPGSMGSGSDPRVL